MSVAVDLGRIPVNYFGPIPGVAVGTCWKYRVQLSWAGVHRPQSAGIHGRANEGVYSLVLSIGSEGNIDCGTEILLTDSIAKKLPGLKRERICTVSKLNKPLAMSCQACFNKNGAEACGNDWTKGKPIRVIRSYRASKYSKFAPKFGNRYDGIYKVVKYFPSRTKAGLIIWNYLLRRHDITPAPWENGGKQYPLIGVHNEEIDVTKMEEGISTKKADAQFKLSPKIRNLIDKDRQNSERWAQCIDMVKNGESSFSSRVLDLFRCGICRELFDNPVTLSCEHTFCLTCIQGTFARGMYFCSLCRQQINRNYVPLVNIDCHEALNAIFPDYSRL